MTTQNTLQDRKNESEHAIKKALEISKKGEIIPGCEKCANGYIKYHKEIGWGYKPCECLEETERAKVIQSCFANSGVNSHMLKLYSPDTFQVSEEFLDSVDVLFSDSIRDWVYFYGNPGTGKTYYAVMLALIACYKGVGVKYMNVPKLLDDMRPNSGEELDIESIVEPDILVLDDIGQEKPSGWVLERLYIIINERYTNGKKTILTSNYDIDRLKDKLGHAPIISRLKQKCFDVLLTGKDRRAA